MNKKYFVIGAAKESSVEDIEEVNEFRSSKLIHVDKELEKINSKKQSKKVEIRHMPGHLLVNVDHSEKDSHTFKSGLKIHLERGYNNLDRKHTAQVKGTVVSADNIPVGALVLFHPNATHDTYKINNYDNLSGESEVSSVSLYAIPEEQIYLWKNENDDWQPSKGFLTGLRIFKPYEGFIQGIPPSQIKETLYVTSGHLKGNAVGILKAADYPLIFNDIDGRERTIIRVRHFENKSHDREEVIMLRHDLTRKIKSGEVLVGITPSDAKIL